MRDAFFSFCNFVLDAIAPPRISERMLRSITLEELQMLARVNGEPGVLPYRDARVTALVWELKYRGRKRAAVLGGAIMAEAVLAIAAEEIGQPLLVPIPMHAERRKQRGHNQTELLCEAMCSHLGELVEYAPRALIRVRHTTAQQGLARTKRLTNVKRSMEAPRPAYIKGRMCIIVDDVLTTGATLKEAERALRTAGARSIHCLALAG